MIHNNKVYANADEKFVKRTMVYTKEDEYVLYHDPDCTKPVLTTELDELYLNGMVIVRLVSGMTMYVTPTNCIPGAYAAVQDSANNQFPATAPTEE